VLFKRFIVVCNKIGIDFYFLSNTFNRYVSIIYITLEIKEFSKNAYNKYKFILSWIDKKIDLNISKF